MFSGSGPTWPLREAAKSAPAFQLRVRLRAREDAASKASERLSIIEVAMADVFRTHTCPDGRTIEFVWDPNKDEINEDKHEVTFSEAVEAFCDPRRVIRFDRKHSRKEKRFFWIGKVRAGEVLTVRFTRRDKYIRIIGAGLWQDGQAWYDNSNRV
jgi:uncharacterized DUF497 family protein